MREYRARTKGRRKAEVTEVKMTFKCPNCGRELVVEEQCHNEQLWCPFDQTEFRVTLQANAVYQRVSPET